jgi:membrane fusion protein (multidrug efflux system)
MEQKSTDSNKKKSPVKLIILLSVLSIGAFIGFKKIRFALTHETTDNAQVEAQITPVLPRVAGYVKNITVKDYDSVKAGDLLVELDDAELQAQLSEMDADYKQAEVDIIQARANLNNAVISLKVNKGNLELSDYKNSKALADYNRDKKLYEGEAITKKQLDDSKFNYEIATKTAANVKNDLSTAESRIAVLQSAIQKAEAVMTVKRARIDQQQLKISYTKVYAPQGGKIGKKTISIGQFVQIGTPMFSIVNDSAYWIVANFKENQIKSLLPGKKVEIEIDAFPDMKLTGTVASLSEATGAKFALLPPDNSSGNFVKVTQRVPVKIWFDNLPQVKHFLRAGLSASIIAENKN